MYHALRSRLGRGACAVVYYANAIYVFGARNVLITVLDKNLNYDKELYKYVKYPVFIQYKQDRYRYVKDKTKMKAEIAAGTSYYIERVKEILSGTGAEVVSLKVHSNINGYLVHIKSDPIPYDLIQKIQQEIGVNVHYVGDEITFLINVTNNAKLNATGVTVNDIIPDAFKFISSNASYDNKTGILNIGTLKPGESYVFNITVRALRNGTFTNIANVTCIENKTVKEDNVAVYVAPVVNLTVTKVVDIENVTIGDNVVFTIVVTNNGPSNATNIKVSDILDKGLVLVSGELNTTIEFLASGKSVEIVVRARTTANGTYMNRVTVKCDQNETVKSANASVHVYNTDLKLIRLQM